MSQARDSNALFQALQQVDADYWTEKREAVAIRRGFIAPPPSEPPRTMRIKRVLQKEKKLETERAEEEGIIPFGMSEVEISRILAIALAGAVACGSPAWACAFGLALFCSDARLRDRLERWFERVRMPSLPDVDKKRQRRPIPPRLARLAEPARHRKPLQPNTTAQHPLSKYCGRWSLDASRSDSPMPQLEALGVPWAARLAAKRAPRTKRIRLDANNAWLETTFTSVVARSTQTLILDSSPQKHTHPVDRTEVTVWSAIGAKPVTTAPTVSNGEQYTSNYSQKDNTFPSDAVISIMAYKRNGAIATIVRTIEDGGDTYHVLNHLAIPLAAENSKSKSTAAAPNAAAAAAANPPTITLKDLAQDENSCPHDALSPQLKHIITHSYFRRDRDELLID